MERFWKPYLVVLCLHVVAHSQTNITHDDKGLAFSLESYNILAATDADEVSDTNVADLIFVITRPGGGSASASGFRVLLGFIQSSLEQVSVGRGGARVALVVSDGHTCSVVLNDTPSGALTKCGVVYTLRRLRME
ncbi:hypothetical protein EGW08_004331, partial [Elysia chlorotica]